MKKLLLKIVLIFLFLPAFAQEYRYVPFPDSNAVWSEVYWKPYFSPPPRWIYNQYALFNEDTIIDEKCYHKLYHNSSSEITRENSIYIGAIREDERRRVFVVYDENYVPNEPYYKREFLLYDFSLNTGDTIWAKKDGINISPLEYLVVKDIEFINIKSSIRKLFSFERINWVYWIEGVGNVKGLLFTSGDLPTNGMNNDLICFHQNDTLLFYNSGSDQIYDDCVPSFVRDGVPILTNPEVKVFPNPVSGERVIFNGLNFETLEIYNPVGQLVSSVSLANTSEYLLDVSSYPRGTYLYILKTKGLLPTQGKLVIQ